MQETELEESVVMDESEIDRTLVRMAHQILEQNKGCQNLALVGIVTREIRTQDSPSTSLRNKRTLSFDAEGTFLPTKSALMGSSRWPRSTSVAN